MEMNIYFYSNQKETYLVIIIMILLEMKTKYPLKKELCFIQEVNIMIIKILKK